MYLVIFDCDSLTISQPKCKCVFSRTFVRYNVFSDNAVAAIPQINTIGMKLREALKYSPEISRLGS
jgi:hypothetical protein